MHGDMPAIEHRGVWSKAGTSGRDEAQAPGAGALVGLILARKRRPKASLVFIVRNEALGLKKTLGAADERIASFVEAEREIGGAGDADSNGLAQRSRRMARDAQPERTASTEIESIVAAIDSKGGGETARAAREIEKASGLAMALHEFDAAERFQGADENGGGRSRGFADDVEHEVRAVIEEHVDVAGSKIHGADARRRPAKMVTGGIAGRVGFRFHDAPAEASGAEIVNNDFADEEARKRDGV